MSHEQQFYHPSLVLAHIVNPEAFKPVNTVSTGEPYCIHVYYHNTFSKILCGMLLKN